VAVLDALVLAYLWANLNDNSKGIEIHIRKQKAFKKANKRGNTNTGDKRE
jgi:hypothetical protein